MDVTCTKIEQPWRSGVPTYWYLCDRCGERFEYQAHYDEPALVVSPCGGPCRRVIAPAQWSPRATPSSFNSIPPRTPDNAWERGELVDHRNMPLIDGNLNPIPVKDLANDRHKIEDGLRRLRTDPNAVSVTTS